MPLCHGLGFRLVRPSGSSSSAPSSHPRLTRSFVRSFSTRSRSCFGSSFQATARSGWRCTVESPASLGLVGRRLRCGAVAGIGRDRSDLETFCEFLGAIFLGAGSLVFGAGIFSRCWLVFGWLMADMGMVFLFWYCFESVGTFEIGKTIFWLFIFHGWRPSLSETKEKEKE